MTELSLARSCDDDGLLERDPLPEPPAGVADVRVPDVVDPRVGCGGTRSRSRLPADPFSRDPAADAAVDEDGGVLLTSRFDTFDVLALRDVDRTDRPPLPLTPVDCGPRRGLRGVDPEYTHTRNDRA